MTVESSFGPPPLPTYSEPEAVILPSPTPNEGNPDIKAFDDQDGPSFSDLLDVINPLQHIPIINTIYRHLTGDTEGAVADVAGGALWGGVIGLGAAVANLVIEDSTGKTLDEHVVALFSDDSGDTAVAKGKPSANQSAALQAPAGRTEPLKLSGATAAGTAPAGNGAAPGGGPISVGDFLVFGNASAAIKTPTTAPRAATNETMSNAASAEGPAQAGDFLVFGAPSSVAQTATAPASRPDAGVTAGDKGTANNGGPTQSSDFLVFGAGQPAAHDLPAAIPASAPTALTPVTEPEKAPVSAPQQTAAIGTQPARSFPIPTQRNTVIPRQVLPMPTTGPAAVPGNARAISAARGGSDQTSSAWFVGAFNEAMDKYNRAAGLGTGLPAATPAAATAEGETANSVLQMN